MVLCSCSCAAAAVVLLVQALQAWRVSLGPDAAPSRLPANSQERSAFKTALNNLRRGEGVDGITMEVVVCMRVCVCVLVCLSVGLGVCMGGCVLCGRRHYGGVCVYVCVCVLVCLSV